MDWIGETAKNAETKSRSIIQNDEAINYFYAGNDDFTVYTIDTRFPKIYNDNNLGVYDLDRIVEFSNADFLNIIPKEHVDQDQDYDGLFGTFLTWLSQYAGMKTGDFYHAAPFILLEHYFYFDILRGLGLKKDPYRGSKDRALVDYREGFSHLVAGYDRRFVGLGRIKHGDKIELIRSNIYGCTSGNTTDLSQDVSIRQLVRPEMLRDHTDRFLEYIVKNPLSKMDILVDNSGVELLTDVILSMNLIDCGYARTVYLRTKVLPVYVSDTVVSEYGDDVRLVADEIRKYSPEMYDRLSGYLREGRIVVKPDLFWNMPNDFKNFHHLFRRIIGKSDLVIVKGDLNFRRLVEDKKWDDGLKWSEAISYFSYPVLSLRTIKSSCLVDVSENEKEKIGITDKTNGIYGTILFKE